MEKVRPWCGQTSVEDGYRTKEQTVYWKQIFHNNSNVANLLILNIVFWHLWFHVNKRGDSSNFSTAQWQRKWGKKNKAVADIELNPVWYYTLVHLFEYMLWCKIHAASGEPFWATPTCVAYDKRPIMKKYGHPLNPEYKTYFTAARRTKPRP